MKKKIWLFLITLSMALSILPAINLYKVFTAPNTEKWWKRKVLYNMDFILPTLGQLYYPLGLSVDPARAIIGKEGWLYLGDAYADSITVKRLGIKAEDTDITAGVAKSAESWDAWFKLQGVEAFRIILGPDKDSVYPEYLPDWSKHAPTSLTDVLLSRVQANIYINPTQALRHAKQNHPHPLYYKTDTHWNSLGAWEAFNQLSKNLATTQPELKWPKKPVGAFSNTSERLGGDLANFLRIQNLLSDQEVILDLPAYALPLEHHDFESGNVVFSGQNGPVEAPLKPLLVRSTQALNTKKVLWLRDSFGAAMAPFMAATFSDTLQVHYLALPPDALATLVERYQPHYVFITVVERDARSVFFQQLAPQHDETLL